MKADARAARVIESFAAEASALEAQATVAANDANGVDAWISAAAVAQCNSVAQSTVGTSSVQSAPALDWGTFERPFAANSPWNSRPVGVVLSAVKVPTSTYFPSVSSEAYSSAVFKASPTDRPVTVTGNNTSGVWEPDSETYRTSITIPRWPAGVVPASGSDGHAEVVDSMSGVVHSFMKLVQVNGSWQAAQYAWTPIAGRGMGNPAHYFQGARAAGVSTLGGLIRKQEVNDGDSLYRHALAMSLTFNALSATTTYQFPATSSDSNAATTNSGQIPMGSLMLLPASFDAQGLGTPELRKVAETLKVHGAYVVDRNVGTPFVIYVENGADFNLHKNGWNNVAASDLDRIRAALHPLESAEGWLDGDGRSVNLAAPMNLLSMRGYWYKTKGPQAGVFDTWKQSVLFPPTTSPIEQTNAGGRAYSNVTWAKPTVGATYKLKAVATGGARFRMTMKDRATGVVVFDSGDLANYQAVEFAWPSESFTITTIAKSGVGGVASAVRAELLAMPVAVAPTLFPCLM